MPTCSVAARARVDEVVVVTDLEDEIVGVVAAFVFAADAGRVPMGDLEQPQPQPWRPMPQHRAGAHRHEGNDEFDGVGCAHGDERVFATGAQHHALQMVAVQIGLVQKGQIRQRQRLRPRRRHRHETQKLQRRGMQRVGVDAEGKRLDEMRQFEEQMRGKRRWVRSSKRIVDTLDKRRPPVAAHPPQTLDADDAAVGANVEFIFVAGDVFGHGHDGFWSAAVEALADAAAPATDGKLDGPDVHRHAHTSARRV